MKSKRGLQLQNEMYIGNKKNWVVTKISPENST